MIRKDLLEFKYYLDRLSMFMKESYGIQEQVEIFYQQLKQANEQFEYLFDQLDIFNVQDENIPENYVSALIDKIGVIFGCYRKFTIFLNNQYEEINLNDEDFIIYIKCQIVKQNFQGTREQLSAIYTTYEDGQVTKNKLLDLIMVYVLYQVPTGSPPVLNSVQCNIYWCNYSQYSENLLKLFLAGYLTIESMGILYNRLAQNINDLLIYADKVITLNDGDYHTLDDTYYIWNTNTGWRASATSGSGEDLGPITDTRELPNFGSFYLLSGRDGDYYKVGLDYYVWSVSNNNWVISNEPGSGTNWGELNSIDELPTSLNGGYFA